MGKETAQKLMISDPAAIAAEKERQRQLELERQMDKQRHDDLDDLDEIEDIGVSPQYQNRNFQEDNRP